MALRYYADVIPGEGNPLSRLFLGGAPNVNYFGGELNHRFYTDAGQGSFVLGYTPDFLEYTGAGENRVPDLTPNEFPEDEFQVRFEYETDAERSGASQRIVINRDDDAAQRILDYEVELANTVGDYAVTLATQGFIDLQPDDDVDASSSPRRSATLNIEPEESVEYRAGPFSLSNLRLNLGFFEGRSNPNNRSAVLSARNENPLSDNTTLVLSAGRLLETHTVTLDTVRPWRGLELSGSSRFAGQYYSTRNIPLGDEETGELERFINWDSSFTLRQNLGERSNLNFGFVRNVNEGETPFAFDALTLGNSTYLDAGFSLSPFAWLNLDANTRYVFVDSRSTFLGFDPLTTRLRLFDNLSWISLEFSNTYDFRGPDPGDDDNRPDPGELRSTLTLSSPEPDLDASLTVTFVDDWNPVEGRLGEASNRDESELDIAYRFGIPPYFATDVSLGYTLDPQEEDDGIQNYLKPFNVGLTLGSSDQSDRVPGFRVGFERDLNRNETTGLDLEFTAAYQPFELRLQQDFDIQRTDEEEVQYNLSTTNYELLWNNMATFQASGFALLPPSILGFELSDERTQNIAFQVAEDREDGGETRWRVTYQTRRIFTAGEDDEIEVEARDTQLNTFINIDETRLGGVYFGVNFNLDVYFEDDSHDFTYLRETGLEFFTDFYGRVGVQGDLTYSTEILGNGAPKSQFGIEGLAFTWRIYEELYISSIFNDTFTFVQNETDLDGDEYGPNFQPEFQLTWNRCCWALLSSWDTATGQIKITLTTPGSDEALGPDIPSNLRFPGNKPTTPSEANDGS